MFSLAVAVTSLLLVVLALLAIPVSLVVDVERTVRFRSCFRFQWLFGLVDIELDGQQPNEAPLAHSSTSSRRTSPSRSPDRGRGLAIALALARTEGLAGRVLRLLRDVASRFSVHPLHLHVVFGLGDPADTGRLFGTMVPFLVAAESYGLDVQCQPDFEDAGLRGSFSGRVRVRPITLMSLMLGFLCSRPMRRAVPAVWAARRSRR